MRFFDRYGHDIREGDIIQNIETGNLLRIGEIGDETVTYTMAFNPSSPVFHLLLSDDGKNFILHVNGKERR